MKIEKGVIVREKVVDAIRTFFKKRGFREVFTPILVPVPSAEPNLEAFQTKLRTFKGEKRTGFLILSPEYSIKKLLSQGVGSCFEITRCFRNEEEVSRLHNPEFTMLEWYRVGADYFDIMRDFENLFIQIIGKEELKYQGKVYDLKQPWPRISVAEAFRKYSKKDVLKVSDEDFYQIFFNEIEPALAKSGKPFFIYDYPISQAALARPKKEDPRFAERFEVFVAGIELGNCFSELTDPVEQEKRFRKDLAERKKLGKTEYGIDKEFIKALRSGLPEVAGIAVGVDRLIMLAGDFADISETLPLPAKKLFQI
jgi:lysyl-tRNA synthetase class 2